MLKKRIDNPRLLREREKLIHDLYRRGFFINEIADIFRLQKSRVAQITIGTKVIEGTGKKNN